MRKFLTVAAFAAAAFVFTPPAGAQVSTQNPKAKSQFTCTAVNAKGNSFTGAPGRSARAARENALRACKRAKRSKNCEVDSCIG